MSTTGTFLSVAGNQDGASPRLVTETEPLPVALCDDNGVTVVEPYSGSVRTIEQEHAEIHSGNGYQLSGRLTSLAAGASAYILIDPASPVHWRHYRFTADGGPFDVELYENPTVTTPGAALTPVNRNRISSNTSGAAITVPAAVDVTDDGDLLDITEALTTGTGVRSAGELEGLPAEWIIDGGNTYVLKITNNDNSAIVLAYRFFWYEG